jgi:4-amino-4-deoxy-L-arabinose transferase-like glycosyltransferase
MSSLPVAPSVGSSRPARVLTVLSLVCLAAITALAAALRLHALGAKSFWMDEGVTAACMRLDWYNLLRLLWRREANMALYYLLLRGWLHFGSTEVWYRGLSVLAAVATVPVLYVLGKRLFGVTVGLTAALLLAVNAYHVRYAQDARSYSLVVFLVTLATCFFTQAMQSGQRRHWKWYVAASALAIYTHFFAVLAIVAHWVSLRAWSKLPAAEGSQVEGNGANHTEEVKRALKQIGLWTLPVWIFIATTGAGTLRWIHRPGPHELYEFLEQFAGNAGSRLCGLYLACGALAAVAAVRTWRRLGCSRESWGYVLVWGWAIVPLLVTLFVTLARPVFLPRYLIIILPAFLLLAAVGLASLRPRWLLLPVLGAIVWFALGGVRSYYGMDFDIGRQDYRQASTYVLAHSDTGDAILFYPSYGRCAYQYYEDHFPGTNARPMIVAPGHGERMTWRDFMGKVSPQVLDQVTREYRRVWVVLAHNPGPDEAPLSQRIKATVAARYHLVEIHEYAGVDVYLYAPE